MELTFKHPEFEGEVRTRLNVFDRPITTEDARKVIALDLTNFDFCNEDKDVLSCFVNLAFLGINIGTTVPMFWRHFPKMKDLYFCCWGDSVDFESFQEMTDLESLCVSGGDYSGIDYLNLDALLGLKKLQYLELHEFGSVDIAPLGSMTQLKCFALRYADKVINIETISKMGFLEELVMDDLWLENADFLDGMPDTIRLEMCGMQFYNDVDVRKWKRFKEHDICEIEVKHEYWEYIDLSALDD